MNSHSVLHHSFADDTQLQKSARAKQVDELVQSMLQCVHDVKSWTTHNKLKLNDETETLIISVPRISNFIPLPDSLTVKNSTIRFSQSARYLGVTLDVHLTMTAHVVKLIRIANFELSRINSTQHYLSVQATKTLFSAFVLSRLDYCNSLLSGCPQYLLNKLQKVRNNAARLILKASKTDYITPLLRTLHWLPIDVRIKYKLCSLCFGGITSTGPVCLFWSTQDLHTL